MKEFEVKSFYESEIHGTFEIETQNKRIIYTKGNIAMTLFKEENKVEIEVGYCGTLGKVLFFTLLKDKKAVELWKNLKSFPCINEKIVVSL